MKIPSVVNSDLTQTTGAQQQGPTAATTAASASDADISPVASVGGDGSSASSIVTLSAAAQEIAAANALGIGFSVSTFSISPGAADPIDVVKAAAAQGMQNFKRPFDEATHQYIGAISQSDLETADEKLGGSQSSADTLFNLLDTSGNGSVSDSELYTALGHTKTDADSTTSQALMSLMDSNSDQSVSVVEYANVEMALTNPEKPIPNS